MEKVTVMNVAIVALVVLCTSISLESVVATHFSNAASNLRAYSLKPLGDETGHQRLMVREGELESKSVLTAEKAYNSLRTIM